MEESVINRVFVSRFSLPFRMGMKAELLECDVLGNGDHFNTIRNRTTATLCSCDCSNVAN